MTMRIWDPHSLGNLLKIPAIRKQLKNDLVFPPILPRRAVFGRVGRQSQAGGNFNRRRGAISEAKTFLVLKGLHSSRKP